MEREMEHEKIKEKVQELADAYNALATWRTKMVAEQTVMHNRTKSKTNALNEWRERYLEQHSDELQQVMERIERVGKTSLTYQEENRLFGEVQSVMKQFICSKTHVVLSEKKDKVVGATRSWGGGNSGSVTVGKFGFGIRQNINSVRITTTEEVRFILLNVKTICKNLKALKLTKQAEMVEALVTAIPHLASMGSDGVTVRFEEEVQIVGRGFVTSVRAVKFGNWSSINLLSKVGSVDANPRRGVLAFVAWFAAKEQIMIALENAEKEEKNREDVETMVKKIRGVLGKWLLLSSL